MPKLVKRRSKPTRQHSAQELERIKIRRSVGAAVRREREIRAVTKRLDRLLAVVDSDLFSLARTIIDRDAQYTLVERRAAASGE